MRKFFSYSVLQYKHSLLLKEALNVGILFWFPDDSFAHFEVGDLTRIRAAYTGFDTNGISKALLAIKHKIHANYSGLFNPLHFFDSEGRFRDHLLRQDDSSLQFTDFINLPYPFENANKIIQQYSKLLLPKHDNIRRHRHDERYLIQTYTALVSEWERGANTVLSKNVQVEYNDIRLKFDVAWKNGSTNLVKSVSLDLLEETDIQNKSLQYFGYLTKLKGFAKQNNISYHLLIGKPQREDLIDEYLKAVEIIGSADSPKRIITEENLRSYSEETAKYLTELIQKELN